MTMTKERRLRAMRSLKMREEGHTMDDIAAHFNVTGAMISYDQKELRLEMSKEFFAIPPETAKAFQTIFEDVITHQYKQLIAAAKQPKNTGGLLTAHASFMRTGCQAIMDLIADLQRDNVKQVEKELKALTPPHPVDGYVEDLSRKRS